MLGVITTIARGALKALLATTKNPTTGKTIKKVFKDPKAAKKWLQDQGATEIKTGSPKGVSARGGQTREAQFPESLLRKKQGGSQVGPVPDPKRKPKIIISGPGKKITEQEMKNDLSRWGVGDEVILELRGQALRTAYAAMKKKVESRKGGGKVLYKAEGSKLINKKKKSVKKVVSKRNDGMSRVGLSPAEEVRAGTLSEAARRRPRVPTPRLPVRPAPTLQPPVRPTPTLQPPVRPTPTLQPPVRPTPTLQPPVRPTPTLQPPVRSAPRPPVPQMERRRLMKKGGKVINKKKKSVRVKSKGKPRGVGVALRGYGKAMKKRG